MPGGKEVLSGGFVLGCVCCVQGFATYEPGGCCFFPPHLLPRIICCLSQRINNGASGSCTRPSMGWLLLQLLGPSWILHWDDARLYLGRFSPPLMHLESSPPKNFERLVRSAAPEFGEGALGRPYSHVVSPEPGSSYAREEGWSQSSLGYRQRNSEEAQTELPSYLRLHFLLDMRMALCRTWNRDRSGRFSDVMEFWTCNSTNGLSFFPWPQRAVLTIRNDRVQKQQYLMKTVPH